MIQAQTHLALHQRELINCRRVARIEGKIRELQTLLCASRPRHTIDTYFRRSCTAGSAQKKEEGIRRRQLSKFFPLFFFFLNESYKRAYMEYEVPTLCCAGVFTILIRILNLCSGGAAGGLKKKARMQSIVLPKFVASSSSKCLIKRCGENQTQRSSLVYG